MDFSRKKDGLIDVLESQDLRLYAFFGILPLKLSEAMNSLRPLAEVGNVKDEPHNSRHFGCAISHKPFADISVARIYDGDVSVNLLMHKGDDNGPFVFRVMSALPIIHRSAEDLLWENMEECITIGQRTYSSGAKTIAAFAGMTSRQVHARLSYMSFLRNYTNTPKERIDSMMEEIGPKPGKN